MFIPQKSKYKKCFKGRVRGLSKGGVSLAFGDFGLKALSGGRIDSNQIEASRKSIAKVLSKVGKLWVRVFPDTPVSKKPADVRMGKGKGPVDKWVFKVSPGRVIFEISGVPSRSLVVKALGEGASKLPLKCKIVESGSML